MPQNNLKQLMDTVADHFFDSSTPSSIIVSSQKEDLDQRFQTLSYGFSARTNLALSHQLPRTQQYLGIEKWNLLGKEYCFTQGFFAKNLNEISFGFYDFLKSKNISSEICDLCWIEINVLKVSREKIATTSTLHSIEQFQNPEVLQNIQLTNSVRFFYSSFDPESEQKAGTPVPLLIFKDDSNIRVQKITEDMAIALSLLLGLNIDSQPNSQPTSETDFVALLQKQIPLILKMRLLSI